MFRFFKKSKKGKQPQLAIDFVAIENDFLLSCESKKLKLSRSIGNEFEKRIKACEKGQVKSKLDFSGCMLTNDHFICLLDTLRKHEVIAKVKIDNNSITDVSIGYFIEFLKEQIAKASTVMIDNRLSSTFLYSASFENNDVSPKKKNIALQLCDICSHLNARVVVRNAYWSIGAPETLSSDDTKTMWDVVVKGHFACSDKGYMVFEGKSSIRYLEVERAIVSVLLEKKKLVDVNTPHHKQYYDSDQLDSVPDTQTNKSVKSKLGTSNKTNGSGAIVDASNGAAARRTSSNDIFADGNAGPSFIEASHSSSQILNNTHDPFTNFSEEDSKDHNAHVHHVHGSETLPRVTGHNHRAQSRSSTDILADHPAFNVPHVTREPSSLKEREPHTTDGHRAEAATSRSQQQKDNAVAAFDFSTFNSGQSNTNSNNLNVSYSGSAISNIAQDDDDHQHSFNAREEERKMIRTKSLASVVPLKAGPLKAGAILNLGELVDSKEFKLVNALILSSNGLSQDHLTLPSEHVFSTVFHGFKNLLELNLSNNTLSGKLKEGLFPQSLTSLDLSSNKIVDVSSLIANFELKSLNVSNNLIKSIKVLPAHIERLDLSNNVVNSIISVRMLNLCQQLRVLNLGGNPIRPALGRESSDSTIPSAARRNDKDWRVYIFSILPHLRELDGFVRMGVRLETKKKPTPREAQYAAHSPQSKPKLKLTRKQQEEEDSKHQNVKKKFLLAAEERAELAAAARSAAGDVVWTSGVAREGRTSTGPAILSDDGPPFNAFDPNPYNCKVVKKSAKEISEIIHRLAAPKNESTAPVHRTRRRSLSSTSRSSRGTSTSAEPTRRRNNIYTNFNDRSSSAFGGYESSGASGDSRGGRSKGVVPDAVELINAWLIKSSHEVGRAVAVLRLAAKMTEMRVIDDKSIDNFFTAYEHVSFYREVELSAKLESAIINLPADGEYDSLVKSTSETLENMTALASILKSISVDIKSRCANNMVLAGSDLGADLTRIMNSKWGRYVSSNVLAIFGFDMIINTTPAPLASSLDLSSSSSGNRNIFKDSGSSESSASRASSLLSAVSGAGASSSARKEQSMTQGEVAERLDTIKLRVQRSVVPNLTVETDFETHADASPASITAPLTVAAAASTKAPVPAPAAVAPTKAPSPVPAPAAEAPTKAPAPAAVAPAPAVVTDSSNGFEGFSAGFDGFSAAPFSSGEDPFAAFSSSQGFAKPEVQRVEVNISLSGFDMGNVSFDRLSDDHIEGAFSNFPIIDSDSWNIGPHSAFGSPTPAAASMIAEDEPQLSSLPSLKGIPGASKDVNLADINKSNDEAQGYLTNVSDKIVVHSKSPDAAGSLPLSDSKLKEVITDVIKSSPMNTIETEDIKEVLSHPDLVRQLPPVEAPAPEAESASAPAGVSKEALILELESRLEALRTRDTKDMSARERIEWRVQLKKYEEEIKSLKG